MPNYVFDALEAFLIKNPAKHWLLVKTHNKEVFCYNPMGEY